MHDPVTIVERSSLSLSWPVLKYNNFIELLTFRLVHVHHNDTSFSPLVLRKMIVNVSPTRDGQNVTITAIFAPVPRKFPAKTFAATQDAEFLHFLGYLSQTATASILLNLPYGPPVLDGITRLLDCTGLLVNVSRFYDNVVLAGPLTFRFACKPSIAGLANTIGLLKRSLSRPSATLASIVAADQVDELIEMVVVDWL